MNTLTGTYDVGYQGKSYRLDFRGWRDDDDRRVPAELHEWLDSLLYVLLNADDVLTTEPQQLIDRARDARLLGHFPRAERLCRRFLSAHPDDDGALAIYSSTLRSLRRPADAVRAVSHRRGTTYRPLLTSLAAAHGDLHDWEVADEILGRVPESDMDDEERALKMRLDLRSGVPWQLFVPQVEYVDP